MKVIVAGSRDIEDSRFVIETIIKSPHKPYVGEIVSGGARGVDTIARNFAEAIPHIEYREFSPEWTQHGKSAGPRRNAEMVEYADALIAVWNGRSPGTRDVIEKALSEGLDIYVRVYNG